jgi:[protein-PII] uridylyltransferase
MSLQITSAKISTYGEKVVDVFYVKDLFGHKVEHEAKLREIRQQIIAVFDDPSEDAKAASKRPRRSGSVAAE